MSGAPRASRHRGTPGTLERGDSNYGLAVFVTEGAVLGTRQTGRQLICLLAVLAVIAGACSSGSGGTTASSAPSTVPLSSFAPEECIEKGWAQEPLLAESLAVDPTLELDTLPDVEEIKAMDVVVGCFNRDQMVAAFDGTTAPFEISTPSAECMADVIISNMSGAAFVGVFAYTQDQKPDITEVDIRTPTVSVLVACVPPVNFGYGVVLAPFLKSNQNGAVDVACAERSYNEQADGVEFWGASYDQRVLDDNGEATNRILYEPGLYCVSFGTAYAASVSVDTGEDLSAATVACIDRQLALDEAVDVLLSTGSNQELINAAAQGCLSPEERAVFGLESGE
ncbi:MAG: hypothetical protein ACI8TP_004763 [Acidimicrobiales bacterium]